MRVRKMAEYIERETMIENIVQEAFYYCYHDMNGESRGLMSAKELLQKAPAADVQPVRRGHWICIGDIDEYIFECSECHEIYYLNEGTPKEHQYNYCPNCGAKLCKGE